MRRREVCAVLFAAPIVLQSLSGQTGSQARYRVDVDMVIVTFHVTDHHGKAVAGLRPADVSVFEDGIPQRIVSFTEGSRQLAPADNSDPAAAGTSVFVLFDTSNGMYKSFVYVYDAISEFVRRLDNADAVAIYTFSRNLFRAAPLTRDHALARAGLNNAVAGADTALFNALLLTLRDAAAAPGPKAVVVFSNGFDNSSVIGPGDVARVAEDEGVPIYVIATRPAGQDTPLAGALQWLAERSGGKLYRTRGWKEQAAAFRCVREEIESSYTVSYYPALNPNRDFRNIRVEIQSSKQKSYRVRTRAGYQPRRADPTISSKP